MSRHRSHDRRRKLRRDQFVSAQGWPKRQRWTAAIVLTGLGLVAAVVYVASAWRRASAVDVSPTASVTLPPGDVRLDAAQFSDGQARFYRYQTASGKEIRFFVVRSSDGVIRAALDSCDACYRTRKGYRQVGDAMVCNACGKVFPAVAIAVSHGGCNPVPLQWTIDGAQVLLIAAALETGVAHF